MFRIVDDTYLMSGTVVQAALVLNNIAVGLTGWGYDVARYVTVT